MLIKNVRLRNKDGIYDILIEDGVIKEISKNIAKEDKNIIEGNGNLALPPFVEPHVHLDTTLTAGEPKWNISGTLFEGIETWALRKKMLTEEDVIKRATTALKWQIANGIQYVRTHVDVTDPELTALKALIKVREAMKEFVDIQIVAFPQEGINSFPCGLKLLEEALKLGADVVGAIPHFEFTREYGVDSVKKALELAVKYDKLVDVHCDEIDDEQSRFVEVVAAEAYKYGIGEKVTASHTTAMHSYNNAYAYKLFRLLKMSNINFISNPIVNTHLQGRFDTYPKRRGITRVKEMIDADINVCFGHDDICDPWYPMGTGNMLQVLQMGIHVCQLMGYDQIVNSIDLITKNSAKTMHIEDDYGIKEGNTANLIILNGKDEYDVIRKQSEVLYSIRKGKILSKTEPKKTDIYVDGEERITFDINK
ncbi:MULTISPECIES: cytosine deaminase [Clostridium]|uniref:Cytosine deaminase n=3 Tax=Clostridium TaxID=1485 RepID=D8GIR0_CLOLD|nr:MULTISPECIES: cytosine deaminase [Clostridium]ADK14985.1 cytosine deaminase [Clostridium ljungdahlii DSM 13528]AGY78259.1 cytosine deaminase [Clostridium autoethanogenum DSM 10061]ALU38391.1 Cytosine deaminase [Clostridium autoethanogenum DSM 10061]OAA87645.1 Cytosine deaminase [Clostridium ljungdahlii DSM 13528]OVY51147.1 Cytosine deaminase [Clostridium autoethanogenum]